MITKQSLDTLLCRSYGFPSTDLRKHIKDETLRSVSIVANAGLGVLSVPPHTTFQKANIIQTLPKSKAICISETKDALLIQGIFDKTSHPYT